MRTSWKVTSGPVSEPLSTDFVKDWLKVELSVSADNDIVSGLIVAARKRVERYTGISLLTQTVQQVFDQFPSGMNRETPNSELILGLSPLISVSSVSYLDSDGENQVLSSSNYVVDNVSQPARIAPGHGYAWPEAYSVINAITVTYTAGHSATTAADFPNELLTAMKLWIAGHYEERQDRAKRYKDASTYIMDGVKIRRF